MNSHDTPRFPHRNDDFDARDERSPVSATDRSVSAYLDGELDRAARAAFEARLATDHTLAEAVDEQSELDRALRHTLGPLGRTDAEVAAAALARVAGGSRRLGARERTRRAPRSLFDPSTAAVLALAACLFVVLRLVPPTALAPVDPPRFAMWSATDGRGVAVWIPADERRKEPLDHPTDLSDGELVTFGGPLRIDLPTGMVIVANDSALTFHDGIPTVDHGALWVRSPDPITIALPWDTAGGEPVTIRGSGSFIVDTAMKGGILVARSAALSRSKLDSGSLEITPVGLPIETGAAVAVGADASATPLPAAQPWLRFGAPTDDLVSLLDEDAVRELAIAHVATVAALGSESFFSAHVASLAEDRTYRAAVLRETLGRLLDRSGPTGARDDLTALTLAALLHSIAATQPIEEGFVEKLFEFAAEVDPILFVEVIPALADATGVGPLPELEVWIGKPDRGRERGYLEKWRALWRIRISEERRGE